MNKSTLLLVVSIAANAALIGYVALSNRSDGPAVGRSASSRSGSNSSGSDSASASSSAARAASALAAGASGSLKLDQPQWEALLAGDLKELVAKLRAAGVPEDVIAGLVRMQAIERNRAEYNAAYGFSQEIPPFWSGEASSSSILSNPEKRKAQMAMSRKLEEMTREAMGGYSMLATNPDFVETFKRQYGDLPPEKLAAIYEALQAVNQQESLVMTLLSGPLLAEDRAKMAELEKQRLDAVRAIMTPAEFEEYEFRSSPTANQLKSQLTAFDPTEDEYRMIFKIQKAFDEKYPGTGIGATPEQSRDRQQHIAELQNEIAAALPPERADQYRLTTIPGGNSPTLPRLIARLELPAPTTFEVLTVQKDIQERLTAARTAARGQPPTAMAEQLAALNSEATSRLTRILGANGLEAYRGYGGGWLTTLNPPAVRGAPAAAPVFSVGAGGITIGR